MDKIDWRPEEDTLIFLGDYIDRGWDSKGVVDYIVQLTQSSSLVKCLLGNHEAMFLDYLCGVDRGMFISNGGLSTLESYAVSSGEEIEALVPQEHVVFFESLEPYIKLEDYYLVHAGFRPEVQPEEQRLQDMIWIREQFIYSEYDFGKMVIFGHTPFQEPVVMDNKIGLDTGAVYGGKLTCLELPAIRFYSVEA
jgi:serine/threonine protein phosphatase 1